MLQLYKLTVRGLFANGFKKGVFVMVGARGTLSCKKMPSLVGLEPGEGLFTARTIQD